MKGIFCNNCNFKLSDVQIEQLHKHLQQEVEEWKYCPYCTDELYDE